MTRTFPIGGQGGWDYATVDADNRRLYVSHATEVEVIDLDSGKTVGKVPDTPGIHGIAVAPEFGLGFTSNGQTATSTIFDLKTLARKGSVKTGAKPDAIVYDPVTKMVLTMNGAGDSATVFSARDGKLHGTIALGGGPEFAVADGKGAVYVNLENKSELLKLDPMRLAVEKRWPLAPCEEPSALAMDTVHRRLFAGCHNKMMAVVDADSGKVVATVPIGAGVDAGRFDEETGLAFMSCGDGTTTVAHRDSADRYTVVEMLPTKRGARTMALDPKTHRIYLPFAEFGTAAAGERRPPIVAGSFGVLEFGK